MFLHVSVSHSVHRGGSDPLHAGIRLPDQRQAPPGAETPPKQTPPAQCMLGDTGNKRAVCILLVCNLVKMKFKNHLMEFVKLRIVEDRNVLKIKSSK